MIKLFLLKRKEPMYNHRKLCAFLRRTVPAVPSTTTTSPSMRRDVAFVQFVTHGTLLSRQTIAAWLSVPPTSVTTAGTVAAISSCTRYAGWGNAKIYQLLPAT